MIILPVSFNRMINVSRFVPIHVPVSKTTGPVIDSGCEQISLDVSVYVINSTYLCLIKDYKGRINFSLL